MSDYVGLSPTEANNLLLLMEGDVSDVDIEDLDSENEEILVSNSQESYEVMQNPVPSHIRRISVEIESQTENYEDKGETETEEPEDPEDLLPLSEIRNKLVRKRIPKWIKKDIDPTSTRYEESFTPISDDEITPLSYFKMFIDDDIINNIVEQTNLYSVQKNFRSVNTNYTEMCQFLGIHIMSGIIQMPAFRMFWANATRLPIIADVMPRNRFEKLRAMLHFNDNSEMKTRNEEGYDKLFKVRPFVDAIRKNFGKVPNGEHQAIDEIMIPFKGRSSLKQYIKNKPHKWGIKIFARAGACGFVHDFEIYVGKGTVTNPTDLGISGDIVLRLCQSLPHNKNHKLFMDNWFTSYQLLSDLKSHGILACGTVRLARMKCNILKNEKELKSEGRGSFDYATDQNKNIIVANWYDNKTVHIASNYTGIYPIGVVKRWSTTEKKYIDVDRPDIIKEYNSYMGGVDLNDMLVSLYRIKHGVKRYYLRIIFHLIDVAIVNAWLLYRKDCNLRGTKHKSLIDFRADIGNALLQKNVCTLFRKSGRPTSTESSPVGSPTLLTAMQNKKKITMPTPVDDVRYDSYGHFPTHLDPKQRCRQCKTSYSRLGCVKCKVALCFTNTKNCFVEFHVKK